jgi:SAM-dependent methyltransferase
MSATAWSCTLACPACGGLAAEVYLDVEDRPPAAAEFGSSRRRIVPGKILRCRSCGFGFRQTRLDPAELAEVYRRMDTAVYESELAGRERTARSHLRILERYVTGGRLLDVGCASGLFLRGAADAGWQVTGVEPSERLCRRARAALQGRGEIHCATLEESRLQPGFDAVTLWDVLEHLAEPVTVLERCAGLLKPDGFLFANVPDLDSLEARLLGRRWPLLLPEHLNYFNRSSLRVCGARAGLRLVRFGRRAAWFSVAYIAYRLKQHGVPGSAALKKLAATRLGRILAPVRLGETFGVWKRET